MTIGKWVPAAICVLGVGVYAGTGQAQRGPVGPALAPVSAHAAQASQAVPKGPNAPAASLEPDAVVSQFCTGCHNEKSLKGQLTLTDFKLAAITDHAPLGEKMIRKLQAGMMPPPGAKRPDAASLLGLATASKRSSTRPCTAQPNPGGRVFQRLNRPEYASADQAICSGSRSTPARGCRSIRRARTSTTSPTSRRCRRRCSRRT